MIRRLWEWIKKEWREANRPPETEEEIAQWTIR